MSEFWKDYCYVDAHYEDVDKGVTMPWIRIPARDVKRRIVAKARQNNAFTSIQRYRDATSLLDARRSVSKLSKEEREREAALLPEQQSHYHGLFFDFDFDCEKHKTPRAKGIEIARLETASVISWFTREFDLNPAHIQCWFTGNKGFHIVIRPEVFKVRPHMHLTYIAKNVAVELSEQLKLKTLDLSVYTISRQWRIPNTVNAKSGLYKIELTGDEVGRMTGEQIVALAKEPRTDINEDMFLPNSHIWDDDEYRSISHSAEAVAWWEERYEQYDAYRDMLRLRPRKSIVRPDFIDAYPACIEDIITNGPKDGGPNRNRVTMPLVNFFNDAGFDEDETNRIIGEWTEKFYGEPQFKLRGRLSNARSVVKNIYGGATNFVCRFIRTVNGQGENGRVACVGEANCKWINDPADQEPAELPMIELSEASKGCYINTKIRTSIHVSAVAGRPYGIPIKGKIKCQPDPELKICYRCPNNLEGARGELEFTFSADDRESLSMIGVNDNIRKSTIRTKAGVPVKCYRNEIEVSEYSNLEEIQVTPTIGNRSAYEAAYETDDDEERKKQHQHVVEVAYHMGHGMRPNKKYVIDAMVAVHPKDQRVTFLFDKKRASQDDIDQFKLTQELYRKLKVFQVREGQSIHEKLVEIHRDFTANVHQIGGRFDLSIGVDLCYHSVIGFKLDGMPVNKGWFELLIIGDTSTGKTTLVKRMMNHFNLGELISGENSRRTGLVWASVQAQGQWILHWGKIPQNDRRLLVIDEFSGIPPEEISKMTDLRSEGIAYGGGINASHETQARTRLILITNPRDNRGAMEGFSFGIVAVNNLFNDIADVRRVDLAIAAAKKEVDTEQLNKRWDQVDMPHTYTSDLCRNLVMWAWSREPHQVEWSRDAENAVFKHAKIIGDTYECDIPLAERGDIKLKIARISAAVAARLFSTDQDAKRLYVNKEHVDYAVNFMDQLYRKGSMSYFEYARKFQQNNNFTQTKRNEITSHFDSYGPEDKDIIVCSLLDLDIIGRGTLYDMVNIENDSFRTLWRFLHKEHLIQKHSKGFIKTPAFTSLLKSIDVRSSGYGKGVIDIDTFQTGGEFVAPDEPADDDDIYGDELYEPSEDERKIH